MPDRESVENDVREGLLEVGYSRQAAEWVITQWLPPTFHLQTPEQRADWIRDRRLVASNYTDALGESVKMTPYIWENMEELGIQRVIAPGQGFQDAQEQIRRNAMAQANMANEAVRERIRQSQMETQQEQRAEAERQNQIAERVRVLSGMAPAEAAVSSPFLEQARGVSPAFQRVAEQRLLPDIFTELGMPQKRREWWETGAQRIGEQLLPETWQEKELMALKRADPWAQLLSQPTFLQQLETRFRGLSPAEKGVTTGRFRPRTRFI